MEQTAHEGSVRTRRGATALIMVTMLWGTTFPVIKILMRSLPPIHYAAYRSLIASLFLLPLMLGRMKEALNTLKAGLVLGSLYFIGLFLQAWGMNYTTASSAAFITSLNVPLVCVLEVLLLGRLPTKVLVFSVVLAVLGVLLLSVEPGSLTLSIGDSIVLACTIFWALQVIYVDKYSRKHELVTLTFMQLLLSGVIGMAIALPLQGLIIPKAKDLVLLIYLSVMCSSITCLLQIYGQRYTTSTQAAVIYTLEPVFASFFAMALLHELLTPRRYIGAALILMATYIASSSKTK